MQDHPERRRGSVFTLSRRAVLGAFGMGAASLGLGSLGLAQTTPAIASGARKRLLRLAHITDVHVQPELGAADGLAAGLQHLQEQKDKPELIINTGDSIFDSFKQDDARTKTQWNLWNAVLKSENALPIEHCIGNHDIWGWNKERSGLTGDEPLYGKKRAVEMLGIGMPYRSFDRNGWHFIVLDSVMPAPDGYRAELDDAQFEWLANDLKATDAKTPVLVMSHIPIFSIASFFGAKTGPEGTLVHDGAMHTDYRRIKDLFKQHANVKLAVSGHLHLVDRADYLGVSYLCHGAVSGGWWKGPRMNECDAGYAMIDLFDDGSFESEYITYGWTPRVS